MVRRSYAKLPLEKEISPLKRSLGNCPNFKMPLKQSCDENYILSTKILGKGSHSKVVMGFNTQTLEKSAIKIIKTNKISKLSKSKLKKEIEILTRLKTIQSNHFVRLEKVFTTYENNIEKLHIAMEYIPGCELFNLCVEHPNGMPENFAKHLIYNTLLAIKELHDHQICHLDLKLENVMYARETNSVKIIDFGFSQFTTYNGEPDQPQLLQNTFCGSIHYAAPELLRKQSFDGKKADVWSLGVLFFALLAGHFPYDDDQASIVFCKIKNCAVEYPLYFSNQQKDFLSLLLEKDPNSRCTIDEALSHPYIANYWN